MRKFFVVLIAAASPLLTGCGLGVIHVADNLGYTRQPAVWPIQVSTADAPSVSLYCKRQACAVDGCSDLDPFKRKAPAQSLPFGACDDLYLKTAQESGIFGKVINGAPGGDYRINLTVDLVSPNFSGAMGEMVLSIFTATLAPVVWSDAWYLTLEVFDRDGRPVDSLINMERNKIFMALWSAPSDSEKLTCPALLKTTIGEMARRGDLTASRP